MAARPDPSLIATFEEEVGETVGALHAHLLRIEQGAEDAAARLADMLRLAHDVKGSARVVGYRSVSRLAHAFESRLLLWKGLEAVPRTETRLASEACNQLLLLTTG
ncbi:MAG TPA: Hpt domain-containing protein, partial [Planctomycetota bacterium]|nr:Hpt domain-containing protein [Planctomycetota bacterium]